MSEAPAEPIDRKLQAEAALYGLPYKAYREMTPRERGMAKAQWSKRLRQEARRRHLDPDEFVAMTEEEREQARQEHPEQEPRKSRDKPPRPKDLRSIDDVVSKHADDEGDEDDDEDDEPPGARPVTVHDRVPQTESDPRRRTQMSIGEIRLADGEEGEDLVGVKAPKNLTDIYSRWPIGDGQHYLRVERKIPKVWERIHCAGYLGELRDPISEEEFHRRYGGTIYALTLYGPDPKGRRDPAGLPIIKAKTEPFEITVPILPPNLRVLPASKFSKKDRAMSTDSHSFHALFGGSGAPATPADAQIHRTNVDFMSGILKNRDEETKELRRELDRRSNMSEGVLRVIGESSKQTLEAAQKAAEAREKALHDTLEAERRRVEKLEEKLEMLTGKRDDGGSTIKMLEYLNPREAAAEALRAAKERHDDEVKHLRETAQETKRAMEERHKEELSRERERLRDLETHYRRKIEDIEKTAEKREKELKDEIDRVRRDEREVAAQRVLETERRFEDRIRDLKEQHATELRVHADMATTRLETQKTTLEFAKQTAEERYQQALAEAERARQEAEDAKDPIKVKENAERLAEAFGYSKADENAPQTPGERLAAGLGMGFGKALETMGEWAPKLMRDLNEMRAPGRPGMPPGAPQLPPGAQPPQGGVPGVPGGPGAPADQRRRRRGVAWAAQGGDTNTQPRMPADEVGMRGPEPPPPEPGPQATAAHGAQNGAPPAEPPAAPPPPAAPEGAPAPAPAPQPTGPGADVLRRLEASGVTPQQVNMFRSDLERAIETGFSGQAFAERFAEMLPEPSRHLHENLEPRDIIEAVQAMGAAQSPILRRDGKKWLESMWAALGDIHGRRAAPEPPAPSA